MAIATDNSSSSTGAASLSRVAYGAWRLLDNTAFTARDYLFLIETLLDLGITTFDHADIYGDFRALELFGAALAQAPQLRSQIKIVFKAGIKLPASNGGSYRVRHYDCRPDHLQTALETALRLLGTDHVDAFLIHRPDPLMNAADTGGALARMIASGKARSIGVSNFSVHQVDMLSPYAPLTTHQLELSPLVTRALDDGTLDQCQQLGLVAMAYSPLAYPEVLDKHDTRAVKVRSALGSVAARHGVSEAAVSLAWVLKHPTAPVAILGSRRIERIRDIVTGASLDLDREDWAEIRQSSAAPL